MRTLPLALNVFCRESFRVGHAQELLRMLLWLSCLLFFETASGLLLVSTLLGSREHKVFVHAWFAELLLNLCLENIQFVLHIPIDVGEALLRRVIIGMLAFLMSKHWNHSFIKLLNLSGRIFTIIDSGRTFGTHLSNSHVILELLLCRRLCRCWIVVVPMSLLLRTSRYTLLWRCVLLWLLLCSTVRRIILS